MNAATTRTQGLDKFYTNNDVVDMCLSLVSIPEFDLVIEPSAGNGAFSSKLPCEKTIALDLEPEAQGIRKQDFFTFQCEITSSRVLTIGNPPFGKNSSLAIRFFNHACTFSHVVAFIIPRTFRRPSVQNRLDLSFHLEKDIDIPINPCAFTPKMSVKCCFQIWVKKDARRTIVQMDERHPDWQFLTMGPKDSVGQPTPPIGADFALRAYGGQCGQIIEKNLHDLRPKSYHWIQSNIQKEELIKRLKSLDYSLSCNTARQNSIGRKELVTLYQSSFD